MKPERCSLCNFPTGSRKVKHNNKTYCNLICQELDETIYKLDTERQKEKALPLR